MAGEVFGGMTTFRDAREDTEHTKAYRKADEPGTNPRTRYI